MLHPEGQNWTVMTLATGGLAGRDTLDGDNLAPYEAAGSVRVKPGTHKHVPDTQIYILKPQESVFCMIRPL